MGTLVFSRSCCLRCRVVSRACACRETVFPLSDLTKIWKGGRDGATISAFVGSLARLFLGEVCWGVGLELW
jgi:hypothetical protein